MTEFTQHSVDSECRMDLHIAITAASDIRLFSKHWAHVQVIVLEKEQATISPILLANIVKVIMSEAGMSLADQEQPRRYVIKALDFDKTHVILRHLKQRIHHEISTITHTSECLVAWVANWLPNKQ